MSFESYESMEVKPEAVQEAADAKLGSFQNPSFNEMMGHDLMPQIRFTTDKAEAEEAAKADRSNPLDLPDNVIYVEPKEGTGKEQEVPFYQEYSFLPPNFELGYTPPAQVEAAEGPAESSGEYVGPSLDVINMKMEEDVKRLTRAQERLAEAIAEGTGVITAMQNVESAQKVLDSRMKLYNEAIKFRPPEAPVAAKAEAAESGEPMLGSVSHAQWKLEQAYANYNKIAIENAKRELAREKAKEEAKK